MSDLIDRQTAINKINERQRKLIYCFGFENDAVKIMDIAKSIIIATPSTQPERDIPKKPGVVTDRAWGIPHQQAVCPNCDSYLGIIHFISKDAKLKVTYCESCGQAIDWEGWEENETD